MNVRVALEVASMEVVAGDDGLFGGAPEPTLVVGLYAVGRGQPLLLGRALARFRPTRKLPVTVAPTERTGVAVEFVSAANDLHFVVLAIALEEDGGKDVRRLYGALEHPYELSVFSHVAREVTPVSLGEVRTASWPVDQPTGVELLVDGSPARCKDDSLVGATVLHLSARETSATSLYRMPFRTADRKNDWTVFLHVTH